MESSKHPTKNTTNSCGVHKESSKLSTKNTAKSMRSPCRVHMESTRSPVNSLLKQYYKVYVESTGSLYGL